MQPSAIQRLYILLRPCCQKGGGYARLEQSRGKYLLTLNAHGFSPQESGIRVLLAGREGESGAAVCDLGTLAVSAKGQAAFKREMAIQPGGLPLSAYSALCIARDWPDPKLLLLGNLWENSSLSAYLMGETVRRYLSVPAKATDAPAPVSEPAPAPAKTPAATPPKPQSLPFVPPPAAAPKAGSAPAKPKPYANRPANAEPATDPAVHTAAAEPDPGVYAPAQEPDLAVYTLAREPAGEPAVPTFPPGGPPTGRQPVTALPRLNWPPAVKELEPYFSIYQPFAPFDAPGWRFVQVPMAAGSTIPYYAVGMLARDGKVTQIAYAVPGERGALPPPGFAGYRWQQGRNGQGYWTLWKRTQ